MLDDVSKERKGARDSGQTPRVNLESPFNPTCMFLGGGKKPEVPGANPHILGENKAGIQTRNPPLPGSGDGANHRAADEALLIC